MAAITYFVTSESDCYGPECTTEDARTIAAYIANRMEDYIEAQEIDADVEILTHRGSQIGHASTEDDEYTLALLGAYEEAHWTDWVVEALEADEPEPEPEINASRYIELHRRALCRAVESSQLAGEYADFYGAVLKELEHIKREVEQLRDHSHSWNGNDYCAICGADGRA